MFKKAILNNASSEDRYRDETRVSGGKLNENICIRRI